MIVELGCVRQRQQLITICFLLTGRWEDQLTVLVDWCLLIDLEPGLASAGLWRVGSWVSTRQIDVQVLQNRSVDGFEGFQNT